MQIIAGAHMEVTGAPKPWMGAWKRINSLVRLNGPAYTDQHALFLLRWGSRDRRCREMRNQVRVVGWCRCL